MVPPGRIPQAVSYTGSRNPGRGIGWSKSQRRKSEVLYDRSRSGRPYLLRQAVSYTGSRNPGRGIGWSKSQRRKSEVLYDRSRSGRPYLLRQAPSPQGFPFPLGRKESKGKKVRSYSVAHAPAGEYISTAFHVNSESLAALSGMTAVALPWVSQRVPHQPFPLWMPWAMSWDDKKPKRKRSGRIL